MTKGITTPETSIKNENPRSHPTLHTHIISDSIALRIYSDTEPKNLKTADLQKGIILLHNGQEVVGEGTGFGVPIAKYQDETFFSGSSFLQIDKQDDLVVFQKEFLMDSVSRDKFRDLKLENTGARTLIDYVSFFYQKHKHFAKLVLLAKQNLLKVGVKSVFVRMPPKGKIIATYTIDGNRILIKFDFSQLEKKNLQKVFILNEQGAQFFRKYSDSAGVILVDEEIGAWNQVTAKSAKISDTQEKIGFNLKNIDGSMLRRGRELMKGSLDWIGLDYELDPEHGQFEYEIEILGQP